MNALRTFAWALCCIYATIPLFWLLIHPFAPKWRTRRGPKFKILGPVWVAMWAIAAVVTWPWRDALLYDEPLAWMIGAPLITAGLLLYMNASQGFSAKQLRGHAEIEPHSPQRLVRGGIRERVRHPIYLGHLCEMLGWTLGSGLAVLFALTAFAVVTGTIMIRQEEKELANRFGAEWKRYREQVPAIVPRWHSL
ncbi:MAG: isoprenylcysteine carboxylmethyltransferase family protein [Candidatus Korobacteraceae bacterium]